MDRRALTGPEGHPFHALIVPLPIGAFVSSFIFDLWTHTKAGGLPYLVDAAFWLIGVGLCGAVIASVFGLSDLLPIRRDTAAFKTGLRHAALNVAAAVPFLIGYAWRAGDHVSLDKTRWGQVGLSAVGVVLLVAAVWLGQKLTYHYGTRVTGTDDAAWRDTNTP